MLKRLNRKSAPRAEMIEAYQVHLEHLNSWLNGRPDIDLLKIPYKEVVSQPRQQAMRIAEFLGRTLDINEMEKAVDIDLYRNRNTVRP